MREWVSIERRQYHKTRHYKSSKYLHNVDAQLSKIAYLLKFAKFTSEEKSKTGSHKSKRRGLL